MLLLLTTALLAAEPVATGGLTVTGQRHKERAAETAASIELASREELDQEGHLDLSELFSTLPGVSLREVAPGAITPVIRGLMGADNLILIDGLRYNTSVFRRSADRQINSLGLYSFEGVELIRGSGGVAYGSGALGGVLSLRSRDLDQPDKRWWYWREFFAYPGNTRYNFTSLLKKQTGAFSVAVAAQRDKFRGRNRGGLYQGEPSEIAKADHGQWDWLAKMSYRASAMTVHAGYLGMSIKGGGEIDQLARGELRRTAPDDHFGWLRMEGRHTGLWRRSEVFAGSRLATRNTRIDRCSTDAQGGALDTAQCLDRFDLEPGDEGFDEAGLDQRMIEDEAVLMHQLGARLRTRRLAGWRLRLGGEVSHESLAATQAITLGSGIETPPYGSGLGYVTGGLFVQGQRELGQAFGRQVSVTGGLRLSAFAVLDATADRDQEWLAPSADLALNLRERGKAATWLSLSTSARAPNLFELFYTGDTGSFYQQAPDSLALQSAKTVELGSKKRSGRLSYQASLFAMWVDELLEEQLTLARTQSSKPAVSLTNLDQGRFYGADLGLEHQLTPSIVHGHQLGLVLAEVEDQGSVHASRRSAPLQGRHTLKQRWNKKWWGEASMSWAAAVPGAALAPLDRHDLRICAVEQQPWLASAQASVACSGTPAWWTAGLRVVYNRKKDWRMGLRIDNLLDRKYRTHQSATYAKGVTARLDVEVAF